MFPVLDALYSADLWGLISAEFFNSWDDRDVHYPNGRHSLHLAISFVILLSLILTALHKKGEIFFQVLES